MLRSRGEERTDLVVGCVCKAEESKEAEERAENDGAHRSVSAVGSAKGPFDEAVAVELRDSKKGAARNVEACISVSLSIS